MNSKPRAVRVGLVGGKDGCKIDDSYRPRASVHAHNPEAAIHLEDDAI